MFLVKYLKWGVSVLVLSGMVTARNRTGRQLGPQYFDDDISPSSNPPLGYQYSAGTNPGYSSPSGPPAAPQRPPSGYRPGPPPPGLYDGYRPGPPPPNLGQSGQYRPGPPSSSYFSENYFPGGTSYGNRPVVYHQYPSSGPSSSIGMGYRPDRHPYSFGNYGYPSSSASASASASAGSSSAAAAAASSSGNHIYGWGPPPPPPPPPTPPPTPSMPIASSAPPEQMFGWGPGPVPQPMYPPRPVPEFSYQFSLKPSAFGWETSYNVPCGNYKIQPRVIAHLRLATQAVLPKTEPKALEERDYEDKRRKRSASPAANPQLSASSFLDPFQLERSLHYSPYHPQQFSVPRPTFRPRTCRWNFNAAGGCKLNFKCSWFQLPALFRCDENFLHVTDNTILLDSKFCGNRRPRRIYSSSTGKLSLTFKSEGAALPAIFDCTVLCFPAEGLGSGLKTSPATTELPTDEPSSLPPLRYTSPTALPIQNPHGASSNKVVSTSTNKRNSTSPINRPAAQPQLRMGNCKCGVPDGHYSSKIVHGRIVGGSSMVPGESPWTAALVKRNSNRPYCGASLINNKFLHTAAHCVLNQTRKTRGNNAAGVAGNGGSENKTGNAGERFYFDVLLNEHDITQPNEIPGGTIRAKVDQVIIHPRYDNVTFDFDAALVRLAQPVEFNVWEGARSPKASKRNQNAHPFYYNAFDFHSFKRKKRFIIPEVEARAIPPKPVPICLPEQSRGERKDRDRTGKNSEGPVVDDYALVTGWGLVNEGGVPSNEMLKARVQIFNDSTCQDLYKKHNYVITNSMMCAGYINGHIDSCVGDSGSPLATEEKDRFVLTGVVSWGRGCGRKQLPGVYTRVTELMDWIYAKATEEDSVWCS